MLLPHFSTFGCPPPPLRRCCAQDFESRGRANIKVALTELDGKLNFYETKDKEEFH